MRYVVGLLLGIGLIVLTFILIFRAFSGGSSPQQQAIDLNDYSTTNAIMRFTIDGEVNSDQTHNRIRITVSKDTVLYEQIQGYEGKLIQSKTYPNNTQSYATFLRSLDLAGYTSGNKSFDDDERGYCPNGRRYIYEGIDGGDTIIRWWSTSCSRKVGSFLGTSSTVRTLFQRQVPDYSKLSSGVRL
jgi:hypothetical protein